MTDAVDEASSPHKGSKLAATTRRAEGNGHRSHRAICFRSHAGGKRPRQGRGGPFLRCAGENDALCQQRTQGTHSCRPTALHGICECFVDDTIIRRNSQMIAQARARLVSVARRQASGCFALRPYRHNVRVPKVVNVANPPCPRPHRGSTQHSTCRGDCEWTQRNRSNSPDRLYARLGTAPARLAPKGLSGRDMAPPTQVMPVNAPTQKPDSP
jgi:hypothetical protein